jgi:hypothetical protein
MMGIRGELFSTKVSCEGRTYFFNVKQNRMGDIFLSIVESKPTETESFDRRSIGVFREDMRGFLRAFQTTLGFMEKPGDKPTEMVFEPEDEPRRIRPPRAAHLESGESPAPAPRRAKADQASPSSEGGAPRKRRVVVRKKAADKGSGDEA